MKKIILSLLILPMMATAQKKYTVSGNIANLNEPAKAYLVTLQNNAWKETDSTDIKQGKFQFTGSVNEPQQVILAVKRTNRGKVESQKDRKDFFLENSMISITGDNSLQDAIVTGSKSDKENSEREAMTKPFTAKIMQLQNEFGKKTAGGTYVKSSKERKVAGDSIQNYVAAIKAINLKFAGNHSDSFMGLYTYNMYVLDSHFEPVKVEPLFDQFSAALKSSPLGLKTKEKIEIGKRRQQGSKATDFTQTDNHGQPFKLSSLRGKYVLVDFWASWCVPCRAENPNVVKAYAALKEKNFEIVSVSLDAGKQQWLEAIKKDNMPWIHVSDLKFWKNDVAVLYGINSVPQNILINPEGLIVAKNLRGDNLLDQLKVYIK